MPDLSQREVARYLLRLRDASDSFEGFVRLMYPDWELADFQLELIDALDKLERGTLGVDNLLITMPPRHAKSTFGTVLFPSYYMAKNPQRYTMSCSYNSQLATDFGRQIRSVVEDKSIPQAFPDFHLSQDSRAADVWRTEEGGAYFAVGIGGTTSGRPANLLLVDDPIKAREDAESMTQRNKTWNYYTSALATRLQPEVNGTKPKQIIILTRWHPDDLAGRLQQTEDWAEGRWHHINFPAIKQVTSGKIRRNHLPEDHPQYMQAKDLNALSPAKRTIAETEEAPLWPERFPLEDLKRRERLNPREFASLYQQQPFIQGGNLIKTEWWQKYPADLSPENFSTLIIAVDTAFKKTETADYSVAVVAGMDRNGDIYIVDIMRGKYDFPELKQRLIRLNNRWRGRGLRAMYIEDKASGQSLIQELKRESGMAVIPYKVVHDKVARVNAILPIIEGGRVFVPDQSDWLDAFIEECVTFPGGNHDDQVDAATMAVDILSRTSISPEAWSLHADASQSLNNHDVSSLGKSLKTRVGHAIPKWTGWGL
jgi:predicted phage terminase large subunit-like protein